MSKTANHSRYWLDQDIFDDDMPIADKAEAGVIRIARMSAARRAVANFVNILTSRNDIEVRFSSGKDSYTDGKNVVISADDNPEHFDSMVGLALHEASHILLSNFDYLKAVRALSDQMSSYWRIDASWRTFEIRSVRRREDDTILRHLMIPQLAALLPSFNPNVGHEHTVNTYREAAKPMIDDLCTIMNILEDRRIDQYVFRHAGGYRPYYMALYERYFFTKEMSKNLRWNPEWREITIENYINRLLFSIHPDSDPSALPGLDKVIAMMDIRNIDRLAFTDNTWTTSIEYDDQPELWKVANMIYAQILRYVAIKDLKEQTKTLPQHVDPMDVVMKTSELPNLDLNMQAADMEQQPTDEPDKLKNGKEKPKTFNSDRGKKDVAQAKSFTDGKVKKKKATKQEIQAADAMEAAQAQMVDIKGDGLPGGQCMVTRKITEKIFGQDWFLFGQFGTSTRMMQYIAAGKRMGQILVHRLQVRNDPVLTKNTRLQHGGLDRRLLAQLGMDITSVFQKSRVDTFKPAMLHLTIDASGSMSGRKWQKVTTIATALAYVGSKMRNVDTVITLRGGASLPLVSVIFDSRRDQFTHFTKWMPRLSPNGATPEGLCFKATMDLILECKATHDVYFINFSDGEPSFDLTLGKGKHVNYYSELALRHTRAMVNQIREAGIKVMSYYISETHNDPRFNQYPDRAWHAFKQMYGEDATKVNVESATEVIRTLNKLLISRG